MADTQTSDSSSSISRASSDSDLSSKVSDSELGAVGGADKMAGVSEQQKCPMEDAINKLLEKQRRYIWSKFSHNFVLICYHYRPQRSWGKVIFSQASVIC